MHFLKICFQIYNSDTYEVKWKKPHDKAVPDILWG